MRRVTGRRMCFVSASVRQIGTRSASSRCWTMCIVASCSPSRSTGEISATNSSATPVSHSASRPPPAARAPPSRREIRQRRDVDRGVRDQRERARSARNSTPHRPAPPAPSSSARTRAQDCDDRVLIRCRRRLAQRCARRDAPGWRSWSRWRCAPPGVCVACRAAVRSGRAGERLCADCTCARCPGCGAGCPRCGLPTHRGRRMPGGACAAFPRSWAPVAYEGVARELVGALKFHAALPPRT